MALAKPFVLHLVLIATLCAQPDRHGLPAVALAKVGLPACDAADQELADRTYFVLCHSASRKVPTWLGYELKPEHLQGQARRPDHFRRDTALQHEGARDSDYVRSGYSRGHLAPAADFRWDADAMRATFLLTNAVPQIQQVNAGLWARLEQSMRRLALDADTVHVFTGPIFEGPDSVIGTGRVAVPSHLFKAILVEKHGRRTMYAAIIPNVPLESREPLSHYLTSVEEVERRTGLNFFSALDAAEQRALESVRSPFPN